MDSKMKILRVTKDFTDFREDNPTNDKKGEENAHIMGKRKKKVKNKITNENVMDLREYTYSIQLKYRTERNKCLQNLYMWIMKSNKVKKEITTLILDVKEIIYRTKELSSKFQDDIKLIKKRNRVKDTVKVKLQEKLCTNMNKEMDNMDKKRIEIEKILEEKEVIETFLDKKIDDENNSKKKLEREYAENIKVMLEEITEKEIEVTESNFPEFVKPLLFPEDTPRKMCLVIKLNYSDEIMETNSEENLGTVEKIPYPVKMMENIIYMDNEDNEDEFEKELNLEWDNYSSCVNLMEEDDNFYKKIMVLNTDEIREVNINEPVETFTVEKSKEMKIIFTDETDIVVKNDYEESQTGRNHIKVYTNSISKDDKFAKFVQNFQSYYWLDKIDDRKVGKSSDSSTDHRNASDKFLLFVMKLNSYYEKQYRDKFQKILKKEVIPTKVEEISWTLILILMIWGSNHLKVPDKKLKSHPVSGKLGKFYIL